VKKQGEWKIFAWLWFRGKKERGKREARERQERGGQFGSGTVSGSCAVLFHDPIVHGVLLDDIVADLAVTVEVTLDAVTTSCSTSMTSLRAYG
jgi:hypothetical protein